jgi:CheY-like chemotaxis protein
MAHARGYKDICFVIDDDKDDQEIFCLAMQLVDKEVKCIFASDGEEALRKLVAYHLKPGKIFIDMNMPRMNGIKCLREIKKLKGLNQVPVYMYSTSAEPDVVKETEMLGATDYLLKPSSLDDLVEMLKPIFSR